MVKSSGFPGFWENRCFCAKTVVLIVSVRTDGLFHCVMHESAE